MKKLYDYVCLGELLVVKVAFLFPVLLFGGIRFGFFTPAEAGAFAAVYAITIGILFYRVLTWEKFKHSLVLTVVDIGAIMFIISMSGFFCYGLAYEQVGDLFAETMFGISDNPQVVLLLILGSLLVIGMFIESVVIILLFRSVLLPMIDQVGVDPDDQDYSRSVLLLKLCVFCGLCERYFLLIQMPWRFADFIAKRSFPVFND
jgi:TRAP-type C4-dicarboxylate transport system permease large subunit